MNYYVGDRVEVVYTLPPGYTKCLTGPEYVYNGVVKRHTPKGHAVVVCPQMWSQNSDHPVLREYYFRQQDGYRHNGKYGPTFLHTVPAVLERARDTYIDIDAYGNTKIVVPRLLCSHLFCTTNASLVDTDSKIYCWWHAPFTINKADARYPYRKDILWHQTKAKNSVLSVPAGDGGYYCFKSGDLLPEYKYPLNCS